MMKFKKWLSKKEEKAFDNGVKFASEKIFKQIKL